MEHKVPECIHAGEAWDQRHIQGVGIVGQESNEGFSSDGEEDHDGGTQNGDCKEYGWANYHQHGIGDLNGELGNVLWR